MKVVFHDDFYQHYTSDPAAAPGRLEPIVEAITPLAEFITPRPATPQELAAVHSEAHIGQVQAEGLYDISALAAGAAIETARIGLHEPAFGLLRPPGHHASADSAWGFCYFNNMAVAMTTLFKEGKIRQALVLDIDLHYGDGNVNILGPHDWVTIDNPGARTREQYIREVATLLSDIHVDLIGISAGFDHHVQDWGGLLETEDYQSIGALVCQAARACNAGCFAILEGGYNHDVLGQNVAALMEGMAF
jgi:acetoin utilization deacetylase AcuC-like enzyme